MNNDLLDDFKPQAERELVIADNWKRFGNYLIDASVFYILIFSASFLFFFNDPGDSLDYDEYFVGPIMDNIISMILFACYYLLVEVSLGGKTIGKYITGTRVVDLNGDAPDIEQYVKRSFSRIVPFEALSFFGSTPGGWHDRWSDTLVIDERKSSL